MKYIFRQIFEASSQIVKRETEFNSMREMTIGSNPLRAILNKNRRIVGIHWGSEGGARVLSHYYIPKDAPISYERDFVSRAREMHPKDMWASMWDGDKPIGVYKDLKIEGGRSAMYTWSNSEAEQIRKDVDAYLDNTSVIALEHKDWMRKAPCPNLGSGLQSLTSSIVSDLLRSSYQGEMDKILAESKTNGLSNPLHTMHLGSEAYKNMKDVYKQFIKEQYIKPSKMSKIKQLFGSFLAPWKKQFYQFQDKVWARINADGAKTRELIECSYGETKRRTDALERRLDDIEFPQRFSIGESVVLKDMSFPVQIGMVPMKTDKTAKCVVVSVSYEPYYPGKRMYEVMEIGSGLKAQLNAQTMAEKYVSDCELTFQEFLNNIKALANDEALKSVIKPAKDNWVSTQDDLTPPTKKRGRPKKAKRGRPKKSN